MRKYYSLKCPMQRVEMKFPNSLMPRTKYNDPLATTPFLNINEATVYNFMYKDPFIFIKFIETLNFDTCIYLSKNNVIYVMLFT